MALNSSASKQFIHPFIRDGFLARTRASRLIFLVSMQMKSYCTSKSDGKVIERFLRVISYSFFADLGEAPVLNSLKKLAFLEDRVWLAPFEASPTGNSRLSLARFLTAWLLLPEHEASLLINYSSSTIVVAIPFTISGFASCNFLRPDDDDEGVLPKRMTLISTKGSKPNDVTTARWSITSGAHRPATTIYVIFEVRVLFTFASSTAVNEATSMQALTLNFLVSKSLRYV